MPVNLAHYLSQHFAVFCCPVELSLSIKLSSLVELSETAVFPNLATVYTWYCLRQLIYLINSN